MTLTFKTKRYDKNGKLSLWVFFSQTTFPYYYFPVADGNVYQYVFTSHLKAFIHKETLPGAGEEPQIGPIHDAYGRNCESSLSCQRLPSSLRSYLKDLFTSNVRRLTKGTVIAYDKRQR